MNTKSPRNPIYSEEFKWQVVQEVLSGKMNKEQARKVYQIAGNSTILYWMRAFSGIKDYRQGGDYYEDTTQMETSKNERALQAEIERLRTQLKAARLRADLWHEMVEAAEEAFGLEIKKKCVHRQWPDSG